ncbi:MAG: SRPBCC family protein [Bacteroidota bacterium]
MKFKQEVIINQPIAKVIELFDDPDKMGDWMEGLQGFERISGTSGQQGAKSKLKFKMGKREIEMIETITTRNLPDEFSAMYEAKGVVNYISNQFVPISEMQTQYVAINEFQFKGIMKLVAFLMPGAFKKQSLKYMNDFKNFAEQFEEESL